MPSSLLLRDGVLRAVFGFSAGLVLLVTSSCLLFLALESLPALPSGLDFLQSGWYPSEGRLGLLPMLVGSAAVTLGAGALAVPAGIGVAIFAAFIASPALSTLCRQLLLLGASLPSVVYGLWGLEHLVPLVARLGGPGTSVLAGALVLALMVFPTVGIFAYGILASFSRSEARAASALALSPRCIAFRVALPPRRAGLLLAGLLGIGRALGETMAVLMVMGNVPDLPHSPLDPARSLTANIALEMSYAEGLHRAALFVGGLLLALFVLLLVLVQQRLQELSHA